MAAIFALKNKCAVMFIREEGKEKAVLTMSSENQEQAKDMTFPYRVAIDANDFAKMMGIPNDIARNRISDWKVRKPELDTEFITPEGNNIILSKNRIDDNTDKLMALTIRFGGDSGARGSASPSEIDNATFYEASSNIVIDPLKRNGREFQSNRKFLTIPGIKIVANHLLSVSDKGYGNGMSDETKLQICLYNKYLANLSTFASEMPRRITSMIQLYFNKNMVSTDVLITKNQHQLVALIEDLRRDIAINHQPKMVYGYLILQNYLIGFK